MPSFPIRRIIRPTVLDGQPNGRLPDSLLVAIPGGRLLSPAARAWNAMVAAAARDGIELKPTSPVDTYRPYNVQHRAFLTRYTTAPTARVRQVTRTWQGQRWYLKPGYAPSATPGQSNHGWGLAIDVANATGLRLEWLLANAERFGFSWEMQSEPWHLRLVTGDTPTQAVLNEEAPAPATQDVRETLRIGATGPAVKAMQTLLARAGHPLGIDGHFGPKTDNALRNYQKANGLTVDGICGPKTWAHLTSR